MTEHNRNVIIGWVVAALVVLGIVLFVKNRNDQAARQVNTNTSTEVTSPGLPADDVIDDSLDAPTDYTTPGGTQYPSTNPTNDMSPGGTDSGMDTQPGVPAGSAIPQGSGTVPTSGGAGSKP